MKKLRHSEMFYSIQGEGKFVGVPSVFLRLFGCNFECPGFGQERDKPLIPRDEMPWKNIDISKYDSIADLPVMHIDVIVRLVGLKNICTCQRLKELML